jgi:hypothetical protein
MPYFVFSIRPFTPLEKLAEFPAFKEASAHAKSLRATRAAGDNAKIKVMFAENQELAEDLLCQTREPGPTGDD